MKEERGIRGKERKESLRLLETSDISCIIWRGGGGG